MKKEKINLELIIIEKEKIEFKKSILNYAYRVFIIGGIIYFFKK